MMKFKLWAHSPISNVTHPLSSLAFLTTNLIIYPSHDEPTRTTFYCTSSCVGKTCQGRMRNCAYEHTSHPSTDIFLYRPCWGPATYSMGLLIWSVHRIFCEPIHIVYFHLILSLRAHQFVRFVFYISQYNL